MPFWLRLAVSLLFVAVLVYVASPAKVLKTLKGCDPFLLAATLALTPVFLAGRILRWTLLVRQVSPGAPVGLISRSYLWGMAVGLVTPGRLGEVARIKGLGLGGAGVGLFLVEKTGEMAVILGMCLVSVWSFGYLDWWLSLSGIVAGLALWAFVMKKLPGLAGPLSRLFKGRSSEEIHNLSNTAAELKKPLCLALTALILGLFILQAYLLLIGLGGPSAPVLIRNLPLVLLGNIAPVTVGGMGLREALGVFFLSRDGVDPAVALGSVFIVSTVNLALPAILGRGPEFVERLQDQTRLSERNADD